MHNILQKALSETLDHLTSAVLLVMEDGRVLHANRSASELLTEGLFLRLSNGHLQCRDRATTDLVLRALKPGPNQENGPAEICLPSSREGYHPLTVSIKRLDNPSLSQGAGCLFALFLMQRGAPADRTLSGIAQMFHLTPAETRTLECFIEGVSVAEAAQTLKISENTVKTHLQNIFAKTGTSRQTHLLKLINDLKAPLRPNDEHKVFASFNNRSLVEDGRSPQLAAASAI